mgnify:FL=1
MDATLLAHAYALQGDERVVFMAAHKIDHVAFWQYAKGLGAQHMSHSKQQASKRNKHGLLAIQNGECALCTESIANRPKLYLDKQTGKILCYPCWSFANTARRLLSYGITIDRLLPFMPGLVTTGMSPVQQAQPQAQPQAAPITLDVLAEAWRKHIE